MASGPETRNFTTDQLGAVLDAALDCIICMDQHGLVREWNPAAERTFGYSRQQAVGSELASLIIPPELRERHRMGMARYLSTGEGPVLGQRIEVPGIRADGSRLLVELAITPIRSEDGPFFTAYLRDITQRKRNEQRRSVQYALGNLLSRARRIEEIGSEALAVIASLADWRFGSIWLSNETSDRLHLVAHWQATDHDFASFRECSSQAALDSNTSLPGQVLKSGEPTWVCDFARVARFPRADAAQRDGLHAAFAFPLAASGKILGVIELFSTQTQVPDEDLLRFSTALGEHIGQFLERQRAEEQLDEQRRIGDEQRLHAEEEREHLLASERAARSEAERVSQLKDEFLATLSHELRTPLNAILGWANILRSGPNDPEEIAEGMEVIERNARAQTRIIEDLLDMSRIISGKIRLDVQRMDLVAVLEAAMQTVMPTAKAKEIRLLPVLDPLAGPVAGDPNRLQQVFWNLLTNAIKFTPRAGKVQVLLERVNSHLEISVIDNGQGIRPDFLPHVFDRFRQADASTTRGHGGLGLGLSIVKQLVEMHGGSVRVKSAGDGLGSTFIVSLPLIAVRPEPEQERQHPQVSSVLRPFEAMPSLNGVSVLVVDDEPDARQLVKRALTDCGASVTVAASAAEAYERLRQSPPDVLVSDIGMPEEDGYSLIRKVRKLPFGQGGDLPAIALTAFARSEDRKRAILSGYQMHMAKPVELSELVAMVASLAGRTGDQERS